jgi:sarcosine oxidase, subunit beta
MSGTTSANVAASADVVVVGAGTVGAWCAFFLERAGAGRVVVVDKRQAGQGASSRAAGVVRGQGGTATAVRLGQWTQAFYRSQRAELGVDSGFVEQGYFLPCFTDAQVVAARARMQMQNALGLEVTWLDQGRVAQLNPTLAPGTHLGGTFAAVDGWITPARNVAAYLVALASRGIALREQVACTGLELGSRGQVTGVRTTAGTIATGQVVLTGGPELAEVGALAGLAIPVGGARHQVAVTEPHPDLAAGRVPMVFDLPSGLYWRPEEGGLLFGMSNPAERPGPARTIDQDYLTRMRGRLGELVPVTRDLGLRRVWAATIEYTPDHLPIIGPAVRPDGSGILGATVACAAGHGMMWGPAVSRAAADLVLTGRTDVVDAALVGLDRFDENGYSRLPTDPIALPFPAAVGPAARPANT